VKLPEAVPKGGETRIRILKIYTDAASYFVKDGQLVFARPLGIKRNIVVLPKGWELIECASPGIVSTDPDGRVRVSFPRPRRGDVHRRRRLLREGRRADVDAHARPAAQLRDAQP
jgi:hypothetical protein